MSRRSARTPRPTTTERATVGASLAVDAILAYVATAPDDDAAAVRFTAALTTAGQRGVTTEMAAALTLIAAQALGELFARTGEGPADAVLRILTAD